MTQNSRWTLYQFPISYYCEKARWALEWKSVTYREVNVAPGLHKIIIRSRAPSVKEPVQVPILVADRRVVQGSSSIIDYLDTEIPAKPLGFDEAKLRRESARLEDFLDETIGASLRSILYTFLLKDRKFLIAFWSLGGPFYCKAWLSLALPFLAHVIEQMYDTGPEHFAEHQSCFNAGMDRLDKLCEASAFLVGTRFSRCDLTMASILAPLNFPKQHPYPNPLSLPDEVLRFCETHRQRPALARVAELYEHYRPRCAQGSGQ